MLAAWDAVEPGVKHNSFDTSKEWARNNCLTVFLDGTGGPFSSDPVLRRCCCGVAVLDFIDVFAPSSVFGRGGGLLGAKQTVPRSEMCAGIQALRYAPQRTPSVLISDNEYFVSTVSRGRASPVEQCGDLWHQCWEAVEQHSAAILNSQSREPRQRMVAVVRASANLDVCGQRVCRETGGHGSPGASALRMDRQENCGCQEVSQDGAEARRHFRPAHRRAVSQKVHSGVPCGGPS